MIFVFNEFVYQPIYNLLILVYNVVPFHDFGVAIIIVTVIIKLALIPFSKKQIEAQKKMQELQPKIKEIQSKHKKDKEKQTKEIMELYKTNKANPFSGCLPLILQLVFLIAIYQVLFNISQAGLMVDGKTALYPFVKNPGQINQYFLGIIDLSKAPDLSNLSLAVVPQLILVAAAAIAQFFQSKMLMPSSNTQNQGNNDDISQIMGKQMLYFGPLLTLFIGVKFPAGLALYWLVSTLFAIVQQHYLTKDKNISEKIQSENNS